MRFYEKVELATKNLKLDNSKGKIIFLNGTTSTGKTTIARELQKRLKDNFYYFPIDLVMLNMMPKRIFTNKNKILKEAPHVLNGYFRMVDAFANCGNNVIVDCVLQESNWLKLAFKILNKHKILFVGVKSSLKDLQKREKRRGDRIKGQASYQFHKVHKSCKYDLEVNTSEISTSEAVTRIKKATFKY